MKGKARVDGLQDLLVVAPDNFPVAVPDSPVGLTYARDARTCTVGALGMKKFASVQIAQRQVRQIQVVHLPGADCF